MNLENLRELHYILEPYNNVCPRECYLCEEPETAMLLPNEEKLIHEYADKINNFIKHEDGFYYLNTKTDCSFFSIKNNKNECIIYSDRPVDCRIFPFYPEFNLKNNSYSLLRSEMHCPISNENLSDMENDVKKVLDIINRSVPKSWKEAYNRLNRECLSYSCKLGKCNHSTKAVCF